nr:transporter substrate-binding domain-containing protein [Nostoc flagelliforme]
MYLTINPDAKPTFVPFEFQKADGNLKGFDIDLMNTIAKVAGFAVQFNSGPEFFQDLLNGNVDAVVGDAFATLYAIQNGKLQGIRVVCCRPSD